ncbi:hypothetical protein V3C99_015248 [Haemonchus contortus]|uniref:Uncharacterized protein n=1 Tax=Haemonchus contortus TaxID=6289 RepID=A0A7I5ECK2_HAECO
MDVLLLFLLCILLFANVVSNCKGKSKKTKRPKKKRRDFDEAEPMPMPPIHEEPYPPFGGDQFLSTARESQEPQEDIFKCRDYTPPMFNDLQNLFDLLKHS